MKRWQPTLAATFRFSGILAVVAPFMKNTFVKRTQADMERFKAMVESQ